MLDAFRRTFAFIVGLAIVVAALMDECPRIAAVGVGLLLMGIFTVPELFSIVKRGLGEEDK